MANEIWCRHYRGTANSDKCAVDIPYESCKEQSKTRPGYEWACTSPEHRHLCSSFENFTQAEIDEHESQVLNWVHHLDALQSRKIELCPTCYQHIDHMEQVGRCVYAIPCNCRLWQGSIPKAWKEDKE